MPYKKRIILLAVLLFFLFLPARPVAADTQLKASIRVYPVKIEMPAEAGDSRLARINIENTADMPARILVYAQDFTRDEQGTYTFYEPGELGLARSAAGWLALSVKELELEPGMAGVVDLELTVPENAEPGGHYTMVFVEAEPRIADQDVPPGPVILSKARVGVLVLGTVDGEIDRQGELVDFFISPMHFSLSVPMTVVFNNTGNVHMDLAGVINFTDWRGRNAGSHSIAERTSFPGSKLEINETWQQTPHLGRFTASIIIASRDGGEWIGSQSFWLFPLREAAILALLVLLLGSTVTVLHKKFYFRIERRK